MNSKDKDLESKNQITNNEIKSEINNKEVVTSNQNDLNKEINQDKIDDNNSNSILLQCFRVLLEWCIIPGSSALGPRRDET